MSDLHTLAQQTQGVYERNAAAFDQQRPKGLHERVWLDRFLEGLPPNGHLLDLGCGAGDPIAGYFIDRGFCVTGVDFSHAMLTLARQRFPDHTWRYADMRTLDLEARFDGIIGWNSFFHLPPTDQPDTLRRIARHLAPNGRLMLTVGPHFGEEIGHVNGEQVYHGSLAPDTYTTLLTDLGLRIRYFVFEDVTCDYQTVLIAQHVSM